MNWRDPTQKPLRYLSVFAFLFALAFYLAASRLHPAPPPPAEPRVALPQSLNQATLHEIARIAKACLNPIEPVEPVVQSELLNGRFEPVYVSLRASNVQIGAAWGEGKSWGANLVEALMRLAGTPGSESEVDLVEICLSHSFEPLAKPRALPPDFNLSRGLLGLELSYGNKRQLLSPTSVVADNVDYEEQIARFLRRQGQDPAAAMRRPLTASTFSGFQVLVSTVGSPTAVEMVRGNTPEPLYLEQVEFQSMKQELAEFMVRQVAIDGSTPYLYSPTTQYAYNDRQSEVRQWLATWALAPLAKQNLAGALSAYDRNLRYNLKRFYRTDGRRGVIQSDWQNRAGIGATALAGLAILDGPRRQELRHLEDSLLKATLMAFDPKTGALRSYFYPHDPETNQNFYPGEALLFWARRHVRQPDDELRQKFMQSFYYYRAWHRLHPNPAFIPWHTQAYYQMWTQTKDPELLEFVFEMNDELLTMQQWDKARFADFKGQFWDPERPQYGERPHVSSTAVYLEGLLSAYRLALAVDDHHRVGRYRRAIMRGLRSLRQHQFEDAVDLFYVIDHQRVRGGLRTTVYDANLRVDNGAHAMNALLEVDELFGDRWPTAEES